MPLYMDVHRNRKGLTREELEEAHQKDLLVQKKLGVEFLSYWYNEAECSVFCLCRAPNKEAAETVHREAHGDVADEIIEVREGE